MKNRQIAEIFEAMADLLEIDGANAFRVRAYRNAARTISSESRQMAELAEEGSDLSQLPDIGESIAEKIETIIEKGSLPQLEKLSRKVPPELRELLHLENLGPKKTGIIYRDLGITDVDGLEKAAREGKIGSLKGFGEKTEEMLLEEIERYKKRRGEKRYLWYAADEVVSSLTGYLRTIKGVGTVDAAGSYRRRKETVGDLDLLAVCKDSKEAIDAFVKYADVQRVISKGKTRCTVVLESGMQVDLRVVDEKSRGAALLYFTGSKEHSIEIRKIAQGKELKINEYGVYKDQGHDQIAGKTEKEMYAALDLRWIEPELRENRGEIEAARRDELPELVTLNDIRGDLQSHTNATDGKYTLEEMVETAKERGYEYLAITDHSKRVAMAKGLDEKRLALQMEKIEKLNAELKDFRILRSVEVDILADGSLDLPDSILERLDLVVAAVHYDTKLTEQKQTERIVRALENPNVNILVHPTGRIIGERDEYEMDLPRIMEAAKDNGCFLEINAQPERLDLNDTYAKMAKEMGVKLAISTDAHSTGDLDFMRLGVGQARRGWLEKEDVINTRSWKQLQKLLKRR